MSKSLEERIEEAKALKKRANDKLKKLEVEEIKNQNKAYETKLDNFINDLKSLVEQSKNNSKPINFNNNDGTKQAINMLYTSDLVEYLNAIISKYEPKKDDE